MTPCPMPFELSSGRGIRTSLAAFRSVAAPARSLHYAECLSRRSDTISIAQRAELLARDGSDVRTTGVVPLERGTKNTSTELPAPRQKLTEISPILKADTVRLHVSREKDKENAFGRCRMGRYEGRSAGRLRASSRGWKDGSYSLAGGNDDPPSKTRTPLRPPWFFQLGVPLTCIEPCIFSPSFLRSRYA
jgi:hypothetical protein